MKKIYSLLFLTAMAFSTFAATVTVVNSGNTFSPSMITINQGDDIQFNIAGSHNVVEVSMATFNANGSTSNGGFSLPFGGGNLAGLAAGTYYFVCQPHAAGGMKGTITVNAAPPSGCDLLITGAFDGPLSGGIPKLMELTVLNNIPDLSVYGVSSVTNGAGTTGAPEFTFPAVAATAGDHIYLATDSTSVNTYFGFFPNYVDGFMSINGDDALELFLNGTVVDVFGDVDVDGTGEAWEYLDGWAYRNNGASCSPTLVLADWTFSGANATDGETSNASATSVFPAGSFGGALPADTIVKFSTTSATTTEGVGTFTLNLSLNQAVTASKTVDVDLLSGAAANLSNTFPQTVTFAAGSNSATMVLTLLDDAIIEASETYSFILENAPGLVLSSDSIFTLTANDDDTPIPTYNMATVTTTTAGGVIDSLGVICRLYGVVNSPDRGFNSLEFSFQDATGAITAYQGGTALTYNAVVGDSIMVIGKIGARFSVSIITDISTITVLSSGGTVAPALTSQPTEANESSLIRVNGLQMVNASQWTPNTGASGFDVQMYTANDTFIVRIDRDYAALYTTTDIPCGVFDVVGVAGQYDIDSPFVSNYQLIPRFLTDIIDTCVVVTPSMTIAAITAVDPVTGDPLMLGTDVTVRGIITSPDFRELQATGTEFTFSDGTGGIWAYSTDTAISFNPVVGDSVLVTGNIGASSGVTRLYIDAVTSLGAATPFTPTVVTTALAEPQEAELIKINGLRLNGVWNSSGGSYNVSATANGITYDIRVDADRAELFNVPLTPANTFNLTGVGSQFDATAPRTEGYQILPRFDSDIEIVNGINDLELTNFSVSPIPASDVLNFSFDYTSNEVVTVAVMDVLGKVVASKQVTLVKGSNVNSISVASLNTGFYVFQIQTANGTKNTNVLVK